MTLAEIRNQIKLKVQDQAGILADSDIEAIIAAALPQFSKDRPRVRVVDIAGDGGYEYDLPLDWLPGFSAIKTVEYPADEREPVYLEDDDWVVYQTPDGLKLRFLGDTPAAGLTARITYTTLYQGSVIGNIPAHEWDAFINLAASECCGVLARYYSGTQAGGLEADSVDFKTKGKEFADRAEELKQLYLGFLGQDGKVTAASGVKDWDVNYPWGGDRLSHPRRWR